jgi:hypothetical protein
MSGTSSVHGQKKWEKGFNQMIREKNTIGRLRSRRENITELQLKIIACEMDKSGSG